MLPAALALLLPRGATAAGPDLECKIHVLAVEFAKEIQPERDLTPVLTGLQVTSSAGPPSLSGLNCTFGPVPPPAPPPPPPPPPSPPPAWPALGHCSPPHAGWSLAEESGSKAMGKTDTVAACEALCATKNCTGFTWHDKTCTGFVNDCYLTSNPDPWGAGVPITPGHLSGICNNGQPPPPNIPPPTPAKGACSAIIAGWSMTTAPGGQSGSDGKTPTAMGCEAKCKASAKCTACKQPPRRLSIDFVVAPVVLHADHPASRSHVARQDYGLVRIGLLPDHERGQVGPGLCRAWAPHRPLHPGWRALRGGARRAASAAELRRGDAPVLALAGAGPRQ